MENSNTYKIIKLIKEHWQIISLIGILLFAIILRFSGLNWDNIQTLHPDERSIGFAGMALDFFNGKFDPDFFAYGSFPIYVAKIISMLLSLISPKWSEFNYYILIGRIMSATAGVASILMVYLTGKKLYNQKIGLLAAILLTFTVSHIQYSHYATVDVLLSFFILTTIYFFIDVYYAKATLKTYITISVCLGLTLAIKISAAPLVFVFIICQTISTIRNYKNIPEENKGNIKLYQKYILSNSIITGILVLVAAFIVNIIAEPYVFIRFHDFYDRIQSEVELAKLANTCYTQQYIGSPFIIYYIKELVLRCMGLPLGILSIISFVLAIIFSIKKPFTSRHIVLLLWAIPYFITINTFEAKFLRYLQPLFPFFCLFSAYYFYQFLMLLQSNQAKKITGQILTLILIGWTAFYAIAFLSIYMRPHTFVEGSKWFYKNVPSTAYILSQHWDEGFPLSFPDQNSEMYKKSDVELYEHFGSETEDNKKIEYLADELVKGDYIVAQTRRLYGATANVPERYPVTTRYFDLLFNGQLGFQALKEFTSYPSLLSIEFNDDLSDESFSVYDHPKILIFKKIKHLKRNDYIKLLSDNNGSTISKDEVLTYRIPEKIKIPNDTIIDEISITGIWILLFELLSLIGLGIILTVFKKIPVSGHFFSYITGLLGFGYVVWLFTSLGLTTYNFISIFIIFISLIIISIYYLYNNKNIVLQGIKENLDHFALTKISFFTILSLFILIRSKTPEIYWGEKPMDFGIFNNIINLSHLPPQEIWFGGNNLNYYYYGHYLFATLSKLTMIPAYYTYNLSIATIGALTFLASAGILYLLTKNNYYALLSGTITVLSGNLSGIRELIWGKYPVGFDFYWATSRVIPNTINEYPLWSILFGDMHAHLLVMPMYMTIIFLAIHLYLHYRETNDIPWRVMFFTGIIIGSIAITNTWDAPSAFIIFMLCCLTPIISVTIYNKSKNNIYSLVKITLSCILTGITGFILFIPYWIAVKNTSVISFGMVLSDEYVEINDYIFIWGYYLYIFLTIFSLETYKYIKNKIGEKHSDNSKTTNPVITTITVNIIGIIIILLGYYGLLYIIKPQEPISLTVLFSIYCFIYGLLTFIICKDHTNKLLYGAITFGLAINLFAEAFYIYDHMNTIFKFFLETWYIFSFCAAFGIYLIFKANNFNPFKESIRSKKIIKSIWLTGFIILTCLSVFTSITCITGYNLTNRAPSPRLTLNGIEYLKFKNPEEFKAIMWIKQNINEPAIILEAQKEAYGEFGRVVMNTGIPTLTGWEHHLTQRAIPREQIKQRLDDTKVIYSTKKVNKAYQLLKKYKINYVYVGWLEAETYGTSGLKKFNVNTDKFKLIYSNPKVQIYKVL